MSLKKTMDVEQRDMVIGQALQSAEGRVVLAQAMIEPIKISLEYQGIGRKLLMIDELPQGALARYERDIAVKSYVLAKRGSVPDQHGEGEELIVPTFEIAAYPQIRYSEIKARRFYIVDRAQVRAKDAIMRQEDTEVFTVISNAVPAAQTVLCTGALSPDNLNLAMVMIEEHELVAAKLVMHPRQYKDIRNWGVEFFDQATQRDVLMTGLYGHLWTADIHVSTMVPAGSVYVLAPGEFVGAMPVRQDVTIVPADDPQRLRLGWVIFEEIGLAVINDYACAKLTIV